MTVNTSKYKDIKHDEILINDIVTIYADFRNSKKKVLFFQINDKWIYEPKKNSKQKYGMKLPNSIVTQYKIIHKTYKWYPTVHLGDTESSVQINFQKDCDQLFE